MVRFDQLLLLVTVLISVGCSPASDAGKPAERDPREVQFITTPQNVVERMLEICEPTEDDFVLDLGCGDGRIIITAAKKYGCRGQGYDIDPKLIEICNRNAKLQGVDHLVEFFQQDIYKTELNPDATIVTMFLYPEMNLRLLPYLQTLKDNVDVVSHQWRMPGVKEQKLETMKAENKMQPASKIYYFQTPLLVDPDWIPDPKTPVGIDFLKIKDKIKFAPLKAPPKPGTDPEAKIQ